ncbi:hypothetical protein AGRA3207_005451 [Actinomadura graeca]|uniref:Uncharacterized protein n=1 Tax=Actinomadura graeca TaxID=2750812 RepID=A0ABX8QZG5_9ACTN|nr:hypothetical protein [Actinomadura graeca]QXJ24180.1 hypothetical protein AGRA3207_005451 [Actinomadura graeca]
MQSSILRPRTGTGRALVKSTSLRALAVAARLEREHALEVPPGHDEGRADDRPARRSPDPA